CRRRAVSGLDRMLVAIMTLNHHQRLILKRELGELDRLAAWVQAIEQQIDLGPEVAFALELCLEEAIANIIMYGDARQHGDISVTVEQTSRVSSPGSRTMAGTSIRPA